MLTTFPLPCAGSRDTVGAKTARRPDEDVEYFNRKSPVTIFGMGLLMLLFVGDLDYVTGPMVAMMIFYLPPVVFVAWFGGRWWAVAVALLAGLIWYGAKVVDRDAVLSQPLLIWNAAQRACLFASIGFLTCEVAERKKVEQALRLTKDELEIRVRELAVSEKSLRRQTGILQSILNSMGDAVIVADATANILLSNPAADRLIKAGLATGGPAGSGGDGQNYLPQNLTAHDSHEHPLLRAIRGEIVDGSEVHLTPPGAPDGVWLTATGRPLLDDRGGIQGGVVVYTDISPRKAMEKQISEISEREQRRIGQDLHDTLCQHLVGISFAVELLRDKLERRNVPETEQTEHIAEMVNEGITQARTLARGLSPVRLEVDGLASALEQMTSDAGNRSGILCRFTSDDGVYIGDLVSGTNLYRIAQEAVNNAIKHSGARQIAVNLGAAEDEVTLTVQDDGAGFPAKLESASGMGLHIMNYRARMIGAALDIRRGPGGHGTIVTCTFQNNHSPTHDRHVESKN